MLYLDASALVKLVAAEPESAALYELVGGRAELVSSAIARVEVTRAARRVGTHQLAERAERVLGSIGLLRVDDSILAAAARVAPRRLRSLDAIHLATALSVATALEGFVVYDRGLARAARRQGMTVLAPRA